MTPKMNINMTMRISIVRRIAVILFAAVLLGGCATNPVTGKRELSLVTTEMEVKIGSKNYLMLQQAGDGQYSADAALGEYVASVGNRVAAVSDRKLPYQFVVLNNSIPNAWALPGGKIAINRGLLVEMENEAELAAVLAHEVVHAAARHGAQSIQRGWINEVIQLGIAHAAKDSQYATEAVGSAQVALGLLGRKYSRDDELTADFHGIKYMHAAGYDTAGAVSLQEKFVAFSKGRKRGWLEGLLATHPPSAERVVANRKALATYPSGGTLGREQYQKKIAHLRKNKAAYDNADRAREMLDSNPKAALSLIESAIKKEPREQLFHGIKGQALAAQGRNRDAIRAYNRAIALDTKSGYYAHLLGRGTAYKQLGQVARAQTDLERSNKLLPNSLASFYLGEILADKGKRGEAKKYFQSAAKARGELGDDARKRFTVLDIADNPGRYVSAKVLFEDGEVAVEVANKTEYDLRDLMVGVTADNNGETIRSQKGMPALPARAKQKIKSGIRYRDQAAIEANASVIYAVVKTK